MQDVFAARLAAKVATIHQLQEDLAELLASHARTRVCLEKVLDSTRIFRHQSQLLMSLAGPTGSGGCDTGEARSSRQA